MSLGKPDLYIDGQLMDTAAADPVPALAGLKIDWGTDNAVDIAPASTLSGQLLVKGKMPAFLDVGAEVGLIDPVSSRCLFAGKLLPLTAARDSSVRSAMRVQFTAASPLGELEKHNMIDLAWTTATGYESAGARYARLRAAMPAGWTLNGSNPYDWTILGDQRHQSVPLLDLLGRYVRSSVQRYADTSTYVPGSGLVKRLTISPERARSMRLPADDAGAAGRWLPSELTGLAGTALLPNAAISSDITWEKTPADLVTAVQVSTWGKWLVSPTSDGEESTEHEWPLDWAIDTSNLIAQYGQSTVRVETMLSPQNLASTRAAVENITRQWLDTKTAWRATTLQLPDSRRLTSNTLLNLLAVTTRPTAAVSVPGATGLPAPLRAFVLGGQATWTGHKWTTELTLGRTQ